MQITISTPHPSLTHRCSISNTNFEHGSCALSPSCPVGSAPLEWGNSLCKSVSFFYTFQICTSTSNTSPNPIPKSFFNSWQRSYNKCFQNADLKHNSSPDSAPCKLYIFSYTASYFELLIETLCRQTGPFCGQFNADAQDTVYISSQYLFWPILILLFPAEGMHKIG